MKMRIVCLCLVSLALMMSKASAVVVVLQPEDSIITNEGNMVTNDGDEPIEVDVYDSGDTEVIDIVGDGATIELNSPDSDTGVTGDDTTVHHNADDTTSDVDGDNTTVHGAETTNVSTDAGGGPHTQSSQ